MTNSNQEDHINAVYRATKLANEGYDPGDIVGDSSGEGFYILFIVGFLVWLFYMIKTS